MNRRTVKAITEAISQHDNDLLKIFVKEQKGEWFWEMIVIPKKGYEHLIPHIEHIGKSIGQFYGEGLYVEKKENYILFS